MHLERLALVGEALTGGLDPTEVGEIVIRQGMAAVEAEGGVVSFLDDDGMVTPVLTIGYPADTLPGFGPLTLDRLLPITVAARDSTAVWVPNLEEGLSRFPALADAPTASQAWVALPLLDRGTAFGVISLTFTTPREFTEPERNYLTTLVHLAALALRDPAARHPSRRAPVAGRPTAAPVEIALLDEHGTIVEVNAAWLAYGRLNHGDPARTGVGAAYLDVCDRAGDEPGARAVADSIRAALRDELHSCPPVTIDCPFPTGETTATILVSPRRSAAGAPIGATVVVMATAP